MIVLSWLVNLGQLLHRMKPAAGKPGLVTVTTVNLPKT